MVKTKDNWSQLSIKQRADLIRLYTNNGITDLKQMRKHYNGIPYKDLNTSDYDYFGAAPDMAPTNENEHWGSRNPYTGQLLKGENHPTRDLMLEGEKNVGYTVIRGYDGLEYSIPEEPSNYVEEPNKYGWGGSSKEALGKAFGDASSTVGSVGNIAGSAMTMVSNGMENAEINTTEADNAIEAVKSYKLDNSSLDALANSYNSTPWAATDYDSSDFTKSGWEIAGNTFESTLSGITTGASVGGPWGAVIGGLAGLGSGLIGWGIGESKAEEAERRLEAEARKANRAIELSAVNTRDSILQKQANNTLRNIVADGGRLNKFGPGGFMLPINPSIIEEQLVKKPLRKMAYRFGSNEEVQQKGYANISDILTILDPSYEPTNPMDDNKTMFLYGNVNGLPPANNTNGKDFSNYIEKTYPNKNIKSYQGVLNPFDEYVIDERDRGLVEELAKKGKDFWVNSDMEYSYATPETYQYRDDVASYNIQPVVTPNGVAFSAADLYDFGPDYNPAKYNRDISTFDNTLGKVESSLLGYVGTPYILRQDNIPVKFINYNNSSKEDIVRAEAFKHGLVDGMVSNKDTNGDYSYQAKANKLDEKLAELLETGYIEPSVVTTKSKKADGGKLSLFNNKFDDGGDLNTSLNHQSLRGMEDFDEKFLINNETYTPSPILKPSDNTINFFKDYAWRYDTEHSSDKVDFILDRVKNDAPEIGELPGYVAGKYNPFYDQITLEDFLKSDVYHHELVHKLNDALLDKGRLNRTEEEYNLVREAYPTIKNEYFPGQLDRERFTTNSELRSEISESNNNALFDKLDSVIDNMSSEELLKFYSNVNGYTNVLDYYVYKHGIKNGEDLYNYTEGKYDDAIPYEKLSDTDKYIWNLKFNYGAYKDLLEINEDKIKILKQTLKQVSYNDKNKKESVNYASNGGKLIKKRKINLHI